MAPFHLVRSTYNGQSFVHETDLDSASRTELVSQIAQGQFDTGTIEAVLYVDVDAGAVKDVSSIVAQALVDYSFREQDELAPSGEVFVETHGLTGYREVAYTPDLACHHPDRFSVWKSAA